MQFLWSCVCGLWTHGGLGSGLSKQRFKFIFGLGFYCFRLGRIFGLVQKGMDWYLRKLCFFGLKKVRKLCLKEKGLDLCNVGPTEASGKVQISNGLNPVQPGGVPLMWVGLNPTCLSSSLFLFPLYFFSFPKLSFFVRGFGDFGWFERGFTGVGMCFWFGIFRAISKWVWSLMCVFAPLFVGACESAVFMFVLKVGLNVLGVRVNFNMNMCSVCVLCL